MSASADDILLDTPPGLGIEMHQTLPGTRGATASESSDRVSELVQVCNLRDGGIIHGS